MTAVLAEPEPRGGADLRLLPVAAAAWAGGWLGTSGRLLMIMIGAGILAALLGAAATRRSWLLLATATMLAGALGLGWMHVAALSASATGRLAETGAIATVRLVSKEDPRINPAEGVRPEYLTVRAVLTGVDGRGEQWRERTPILVSASGDAVSGWRGLVAGSSVVATVKLQTPQQGSDFAAVARSVGPPREIGRPGPVGRLVERVRAGLRDAVDRGSPEQRALVPSLVLGDTAGITADIKADFLTTGLTHLTAVSGTNLRC